MARGSGVSTVKVKERASKLDGRAGSCTRMVTDTGPMLAGAEVPDRTPVAASMASQAWLVPPIMDQVAAELPPVRSIVCATGSPATASGKVEEVVMTRGIVCAWMMATSSR